MRKIICLCVSLIMLLCSACGNTEIPFTTTEDNQESSQASDEVPSTQNIDIVPQNCFRNRAVGKRREVYAS